MIEHPQGIQQLFIESTQAIFSSLTGLTISYHTTRQSDQCRCEHELTGVLDFVGKPYGAMALGMSKNLTYRLSQIITQLEPKDLSDDIIHDTLGEMVNQISGLAQSKCTGTPYKFSIAIPRVCTKVGEYFTTQKERSCEIISFTLADETLSLYLLLSITDQSTKTDSPTKVNNNTSSPSETEDTLLVFEEDMEEVITAFITESEEFLEQLNQDLVTLDKSNDDQKLIQTIFRILHTLKGNARALGFSDMETLVHRIEDLFRKAQNSDFTITSEAIDIVFEALDLIQQIVSDVKERHKGTYHIETLLEKLDSVINPKPKTTDVEHLEIEEDLQEIVDGFVIESEEFIEQLDNDLVSLDKNHEESALVENIFRTLHTLKGNARALGFTDLETLVHRTEDVIRKVHKEGLQVSASMLDTVLQAIDVIKIMIQDIKERKKRRYTTEDIINDLAALLEDKAETVVEEKLEIDDDLQEIVEGFVLESEEILSAIDGDLIQLEKTPQDLPLIDKIFRELHTLKGNARSLTFTKLEELTHRTEDVIRKAKDGKLKITPESIDVILRAVDGIKLLVNDVKRGVKSTADLSPLTTSLTLVLEEKYVAEPQPKESKPSTVSSDSRQRSPAPSTIRVDIGKLDKLIDVTGELVLHKNRLLNLSSQIMHGLPLDSVEEFLNEVNAQMGFLVSDLQSGVMSTRMQPIGKVFGKYPRVVRDLARESKKEIELIISGEETELDNRIVEEIGDPLIHMVRNSCDHGIETPDKRIAQGKQSLGTIHLKAYYEGNFVVIEIQDDGKGIDHEIIKKKALSKELISEAQANTMGKGDILNLIFLPGFSTADKVTAVSGRGVGMDVVKTSITKLNGLIEMDSEPGVGTTVTIKLPLTLAVMVGLEVEVGMEKYLLPQESIVEIVTVSPDTINHNQGKFNFLFRDEFTLPLIDLKQTLQVNTNNHQSIKEGYIVVIGEAEKRTGLLVDNIIQQHEVVIKPLGKYINNFPLHIIHGATIMGDGSIELIINHNHLMRLAQDLGN